MKKFYITDLRDSILYHSVTSNILIYVYYDQTAKFVQFMKDFKSARMHRMHVTW